MTSLIKKKSLYDLSIIVKPRNPWEFALKAILRACVACIPQGPGGRSMLRFWFPTVFVTVTAEWSPGMWRLFSFAHFSFSIDHFHHGRSSVKSDTFFDFVSLVNHTRAGPFSVLDFALGFILYSLPACSSASRRTFIDQSILWLIHLSNFQNAIWFFAYRATLPGIYLGALQTRVLLFSKRTEAGGSEKMASLLKRKVTFYGSENNSITTASNGLSVFHFIIIQKSW